VSEGKKWVQVKSYFAKFDNFEDFTNRYISFLSSARYAKARESTTPAQFGSEVAKAGYATASADKYSAKVASFAESFNNSGNQIDSVSKENKDLKADMANKDKAPIIVNNNTTNTQGKASAPTSSPADDRPAYMKKAQGQ
jgi:flagellum-specific peptidoglycan hydrolase FlgJ